MGLSKPLGANGSRLCAVADDLQQANQTRNKSNICMKAKTSNYLAIAQNCC
jgi:hypothetical protein